MKESNKIFYDIHCHAFNLSHAGLLAFLNRFFLNNALTFKDLLNGKFFRILIKLFQCRKSGTGCWLKRLIGLIVGIFLLLILGFLINPAILGIDISTLSSVQKFLVRGFMVFILFVAIALAILIIYWINKKRISNKIHNMINLLSLMENDLGRQFLYLELDILSKDPTAKNLVKKIIENYDDRRIIDKVRQEWERKEDRSFEINKSAYKKVVLTPLMMDFNYKDFKGLEEIFYNLPPRKPIIDQVVDLYNGMRDYAERSAFQILEIYPFFGINPKNYELGIVEEVTLNAKNLDKALRKKISYLENYRTLSIAKKLDREEVEKLEALAVEEKDKETIWKMVQDFDAYGFEKRNCIAKMLHKYFGDYEPKYENFEKAFKDNILTEEKSVEKEKVRKISNYFFAGIKVYPPLDFDPWPEDSLEFQRVNYIYQFCCEKRIPITTHCSDSGFMVIEQKNSWKFTSPERWAHVLREYPNLKLNFAHFGSQSYTKKNEWCRRIIDLVIYYENVYADFSYRGVNERFYKNLDRIISTSKKDKIDEIKNRVLFGSDFLINLIEMESYCEYLSKFFKAPEFTSEKIQFCTANPEGFLFANDIS